MLPLDAVTPRAGQLVRVTLTDTVPGSPLGTKVILADNLAGSVKTNPKKPLIIPLRRR